ncbi:hypothetical protein [Streptomyces sp. Ru72]|uniref:SCO6745 family protein n=1 Tax=Streptomyces sp. Ru72 TaxID=2080747 RepID=UPI000CDD09EE|nr:hypothetical protein [Streptomyces sp. Ru72]POX46536.1 hypothetical protein C3488_26255 [Streptomyces sp. Ru72]
MTMTSLPERVGRRCQDALNSLHSTVYFAPDLEVQLADHSIDDPMAVYLAGRSAALGPVGSGVVTAAFYGFKHELIARHIPRVWAQVSPGAVLEMRLRAADATLRRHLGEAVTGPEMAEAAELALRAARAGDRAGRPLYSAHADQPVPEEPHLVLWYAATLLREHRGDCHIAALQNAELGGLDALVSHSASSSGMPKEIVMSKRGWTEEDWAGAQDRLRARGLMDAEGHLTTAGVELREDIEAETDRLDRAPYETLGLADVTRLTELVGAFAATAAATGAFPAELLQIFARR